MLAKKHEEFIDLKEKPSETLGMPMESKPEKPKPRGPTIYIRDIDLPITEEDLNNSLLAEVKLTPRTITKREENGKKSVSYDLELTGIKFKS